MESEGEDVGDHARDAAALRRQRIGAQPWKVCSASEERLHFITRPIEREVMTDPCSEFSISRNTGYKHPRGRMCAASAQGPPVHSNRIPHTWQQ